MSLCLLSYTHSWTNLRAFEYDSSRMRQKFSDASKIELWTSNRLFLRISNNFHRNNKNDGALFSLLRNISKLSINFIE